MSEFDRQTYRLSEIEAWQDDGGLDIEPCFLPDQTLEFSVDDLEKSWSNLRLKSIRKHVRLLLEDILGGL